MKTGILGNKAEKLAAKFLNRQGLKTLQKNYTCRFGEIDIIMQHAEYLVFVEVRYRQSQDYGGALASVNTHKQLKLRKTAEHYLQRLSNSDVACRFDVLCITGNLKQPEFEWIENAF